MTDEKTPGVSGDLNDLPQADHTGRVRTAVHAELQASKSEFLVVLRRWWFIAVTVGGAVWYAAGYLGGKADASDVTELRESIEKQGNRITAVEQLLPAVVRIENQLYQLAVRAGAPVVTQPATPPLR